MIKINLNVVPITLFLLFSLAYPLYSQIGFKAKKLNDKLNAKFIDKTTKVMGVNEYPLFKKKFEMENDQYIFENDTIRFTLNFISDSSGPKPTKSSKYNEDGTLKRWCDDYDAILEIRNLGKTDIKFRRGQRLGFGRDDDGSGRGKELKRVINAKKLEDNLAPSLYGIYKIVLDDRLMLEAIGNTIDSGCEEKDRIYAAGDPNTYGDIENSALYIRYKVALRDLYTENKSLYFEFKDQYKVELLDYQPNYITLNENPSWSRNWRNEDSDYTERLNQYMVENDVAGVFGIGKKEKKKKKNKN
tara:strand:- start:1497 stop:2399 length:903 start_codon:yes stop_codon:yes gene_type:complete